MVPESPRREGTPTVVVVDDDQAIRTLITVALGREGIGVREAADLDRALALARAVGPDLVLLDVMLPGASGLDAIPQFREMGVPVILVTGRDDITDRILGLELGADDYVVKPFHPRELASRVRAVLRRMERSRDAEVPLPRLEYGRLVVDTATREVSVDGDLVVLTAREFDLLAYLAARPRRVCSYDELLERVWNSSPEWQNTATVTEHVRRVRHKIEADPGNPRWLLTARGVGYRFEP